MRIEEVTSERNKRRDKLQRAGLLTATKPRNRWPLDRLVAASRVAATGARTQTVIKTDLSSIQSTICVREHEARRSRLFERYGSGVDCDFGE